MSQIVAGQTPKLSLRRPLVFRLLWIPLLIIEVVAQHVFHRHDVAFIALGVLVAVVAVRWALLTADEKRAEGGEEQ